VIRKLILGLALVWAGWAFLAETQKSLDLFDRRQSRPFTPPYWRFGVRQLDDFQTFIEAARREVPAGSRIAFVSREGPDSADFFRWRWAAYLMPEMDVLHLSDFERGEPAAYGLAFRRELDDSRMEEIRRLPGGRLYRVRTP
jgi:hypothetical protein